MSTLLDYQIAAKEFAKYPKEHALYYTTLGLCGEAGEVANKVKKIYRDKGGVLSQEDKKNISLELGDVLWYISDLAGQLGYRLDEIAYQNIAKLDVRRGNNTINGAGDNR